jgi:hypothetical protein
MPTANVDPELPKTTRAEGHLCRPPEGRPARARRPGIDEISPYAGEVSPAWRLWARATLAPKVDYLATIRHVVRRALRESTLGRYDRTYRRPHRRQACYGEFLMPSFHQPRPRPGFLIDTSSSM